MVGHLPLPIEFALYFAQHPPSEASMKVHLKALGCRLNEAELEQWSQQFQADGHSITTNGDADLVVLNTCAVTNEASRKSRYLINRLHRENPDAKLIVTGCHASLEPEQVAGNLGVDLVIRNEQKSDLPAIAREQLQLPTMPVFATEPDSIALYSRGRHRAFIKVQDGCRYRCTFCIVTVARGEERSRNIEEIVSEVQRFHASGIQEIVLAGVHVGGYGSDTGSSLIELVRAILNDTDIPRIRFASVEPWDLPNDFFDLFKNPRLMPHMHLPLQSGSDAILRRMARRCKTAEFRELAIKAREAIPNFNITTDIIVGFPGETDEDWKQSMRFIESVGFGHIHVFPYSPRSGTKAASLPNQIDKTTKQQRCRELAALADDMKQQAMRKMIGQSAAVLWEKPGTDESGKQWFTGYTPNYHRVETSSDDNLEYRVSAVELTRINNEKLILQGTTRDNDHG